MCSGEATQDLSPDGQVGEVRKCRVRTKSCGLRVRLGDLPRRRDIWGFCQPVVLGGLDG